jgi:hypothetical protein
MKSLLPRAIFPLALLAFAATLPRIAAAQEPQAAAPAAGTTAAATPDQNQANIPNAADVIRKMHDAQYNLPKHGMKGFRCSITIDWDAFYKDLGADSASSQALLSLLKKTRFRVVVGPDGSSSVSRESDEPPSADIADRLQQSQAGVDQVINGLLKTWAIFMVQSVIPQPDEKYRLVLVDGKYLLTQSTDSSNLAIDFDSNFMMERVSTRSTKTQSGVFRPTFANSPNGFVLTGYTVTFDPPVDGQTANADVKIENQAVDDLELPHIVNIKLPYKNASLKIHMTFSDYQVTYKLVDLK